MFPDASYQRPPPCRTAVAARIPASPRNEKDSKSNPGKLDLVSVVQVLLELSSRLQHFPRKQLALRMKFKPIQKRVAQLAQRIQFARRHFQFFQLLREARS